MAFHHRGAASHAPRYSGNRLSVRGEDIAQSSRGVCLGGGRPLSVVQTKAPRGVGLIQIKSRAGSVPRRSTGGNPPTRTRPSRELKPIRPPLPQHHVQVRDVSAHFQSEHRDAQSKADPKPTAHVDELRAAAGGRLHELGFTRAIPQMGHEPGPTCRICGCIGRV